MLDRIHAFVAEHRLAAPGDTLLAACSGGPDSVALLHLLVRLRESTGIRVEAAHLDHGLRGEDSRADAAFVADLARDLDITLHHRVEDMLARHGREGGSLEALARRVRRSFLEEACRMAGARFVLTGHTRDDQAETLLLNLLRGSGPRGLGAMLPVGPGPWARPFLAIDKAEILAFLTAEQIPFRADATNSDPRFARNRVRERLVPLLQAEFNPSVTRVLAREAGLFAELDAYLAGIARDRFAGLAETRPEGLRIDLARFRDEPPVLQRSLLREALEQLLGDLRECDTGTVEGLRDLAAGHEGTAERALPRGAWARREYDDLLLTRGTPTDEAAPRDEAVDPDRPSEVRWGDRRLRWGPGPAVVPAPGEEDRAVFDREALVPPLRVRPARPGDRLEPAGMLGSRKLQDLLTDQKVPRRLRDRIPVLCDNGGPRGEERILWVIGRRRSKHAPVGPDTTRAVVFHAEPDAQVRHPR